MLVGNYSIKIPWTKRAPAIILYTAFLALIVVWLTKDSQSKRMARAAAHIPKVNALIHPDPRFSEVKAQPYTGPSSTGPSTGPGSLGLYGSVKSEQDLEALRALVESTKPPVGVSWHVIVMPDFPDSDTVKSRP